MILTTKRCAYVNKLRGVICYINFATFYLEINGQRYSKTGLTYDSNGEYPEEQSVQHHRYVLPVLLHLVAVLHDAGDLRDVLDPLHGPDQLGTEARLGVAVGVLVVEEVSVKLAAGGVHIEGGLPMISL